MHFNDIKIRPSFFDDETNDNFQLWKKGQPAKRPSEIRVMEGNLFKKSSRTNFMKSRYYVLFEDRLACFKNGREDREHTHCLMHNLRLEPFSNAQEKDEKYGIRLIHNNTCCEFFARAKDLYDKWLAALASLCVLTSYSSNFINVKVIGKGSFAKVHLVKRKIDGVELAVKTFDKGLLSNQDKAKASLISEINIMRRLNHESIIKLHDVYEGENHIYLVLELLNGGELFDRIVKKGQYTEHDACTLMKKLLSALEFMHSKGIMHRDIKPENLILKDVENDWNVKIADFGLATFLNPNGDYLFKRCGTPGYVAPEVLADMKYDQKVDVFSCGVILYIILTGGSPFYGKSYNEILWKNKVCDISFNFKEIGHKVSEQATDLMKKMLCKDPANRITATEALNHEWVLSGGSFTSPSSSSPYYLCSAQENMKRFQEENRFNVKSIKPKDLNKADLMEKSGHCPSPLINGHVSTMISNSPDLRRQTKSKFAADSSSPYVSSRVYEQPNTSHGSLEEEHDDSAVDCDEHNMIVENISKYNNGFTLISQVKDTNSSSTNSSKHSTPLLASRNPVESTRKAMNVQEQLLGYLKPMINSQYMPADTQMQKKTDNVKNTLKLLG